MNAAAQTKKPDHTPTTTEITRYAAREIAMSVTPELIMQFKKLATPRKCQSHLSGHVPSLLIFDGMNRKERARVANTFANMYDMECPYSTAAERDACLKNGSYPCLANVQQKLQADS